MADSNVKKKVAAAFSGNQTSLQIVDPGNNGQGYGYQRAVIDAGIITLQAGGSITLVSTNGAVIVPAFFVGTNIQFNLSDLAKTGELKSEPGEGILLTTTGNGNGAYELIYHYEP